MKRIALQKNKRVSDGRTEKSSDRENLAKIKKCSKTRKINSKNIFYACSVKWWK